MHNKQLIVQFLALAAATGLIRLSVMKTSQMCPRGGHHSNRDMPKGNSPTMQKREPRLQLPSHSTTTSHTLSMYEA